MIRNSILISINTSWNIYNFRAGLIDALRAEGYRVISAAPPDDYSARLTTLVDAHIDLPMDNAGTSPVKDLRLLWRYIQTLRAVKPSVMLTYTIKPNIYGAMAGWVCGVPVIANVSGLGTAFLHHGWRMRLVRPLYRLAFCHVEKVFFQNAADRDLFVSMRLLPARKAQLLPGSGVNLAYFHPSYNAVRSEASAPAFVLVARLLLDKGVAEYVEAAQLVRQRYPQARFHLVGPLGVANRTAVTASMLQCWQGERHIEYLGETDDVRQVFATHDCVVLPSYREGMSRVLLEAAAMGKPLIATDVPGCREIVEHEKNGLLCPPRDAQALAHQMVRFIEASAEERAAWGQYSRRKAEQEFDEARVMDAYRRAISECVPNFL